MLNKTTYKTAYYALININADDSYYDALLQLVIYVIKRKNYIEIDIKTLCVDFNKIIGFEIPYFPMEKIIGNAYRQGYVKYNDHSKRYEPDYSEIKKTGISNNIDCGNMKFKKLLEDFCAFVLHESKETISVESAEKIINDFIENQGVLLFSEREQFFSNEHEDYLFASYLQRMQKENLDMFNYVFDLVVGRIFSELVFYDYEEDPKFFSGLTVYLDTGFVLRLLGIDGLDRKDAYISLVHQMHKLGIQTKVFDHTFSELFGIIANSIQWINNHEYNSAIANETAYYFVSNHIEKEKVEDLLIRLEVILEEMGIAIDNVDYPQNLPAGVISEVEYYQVIVDGYTENNIHFDEEKKRPTVECDAKSFFYVDYLCKGLVAQGIKNAKYLFVTTNFGLSKISRKVAISTKKGSAYSIPFCVTDRFMGVMLWKSSPDTLRQDCYNRLLVAMNEAFAPSDDLLQKLNEALTEELKEGTLTPEECYLLKTSRQAHRYLMDVTKGDVDNFTSKTPREILKELQDEAREKGVEEERVRANEEISELQEIIGKKDLERETLRIKNIDQSIEIFELKRKACITRLSRVEEQLSDIEECEKEAIKKGNRKRNIFVCIYLMALCLYLVVGIFVWRCSIEMDWFSLYTFIMAGIGVVFTYVYFAVTGATFNIFNWSKSVVDKAIERYLIKNNATGKEKELLVAEKSKLKEDIDSYRTEAERLMALK